MNITHYLRTYNQEITLILFCVGMVFYALGLWGFTKSFSTQSFFHLGGLLFIAYNYRSFRLRAWRILALPLLCFAVVTLLGLVTLFDEVWQRKTSVVLKSINQNILGYCVLFVLVFLYAMYAKLRCVLYFLCFFALLCFIEVCSTIYLGIHHGFFKTISNVPFYFKAVFTYNIWLLAPAAISLAGILALKQKYLKILSALGLILTFIAMLANGERSFLVALLAMLFAPFVFWHFRHKLLMLVGVLCVFMVCLWSFYHMSKSLPERYNFAHMLDNFLIVWASAPIEMGQFDKSCFKKQKWLTCAKESIEIGKNEISIEHSALSRINMSKSTLLALLDEPFKPHIVGVFQIGEYLWHYYNLKNHQNRSYIIQNDPANKETNGYNHPHNFALSLAFSYGIFGFICIVIFQGFVLYSAYRGVCAQSDYKKFWALVLGVFVVGVMAQSVFDAFYTGILQCIFIVLGMLVGLGWRDEDTAYHR